MNTHIKEASYGKRILAYFLDVAMVLVLGGITYGLVTSKYMFDGLGGSQAQQNMYHFGSNSNLLMAEDSSGKEIPSPSKEDSISMMAMYTYSETKSGTQEENGYALYFTRVWNYYTSFLNVASDRPANLDDKPIDRTGVVAMANSTTTTPFTSDDYYTYLEVTLLRLPVVSKITDPSQESQLQQTKINDSDPVYFKYALNEAGTAVDIHKKPVLVQSYQTLVDSNDATALTALQKYMYDSANNKGVYYDACLNLEGNSSSVQTFYSKNYILYNMILWECMLTAFVPFHLIFMLIIPLCMKQGETLGKLICKIGVASKEGWALPIRGRILHPLCLSILGGFAILPWSTIGIMAYVVIALVDYMVLVMSKTHQSIHDKIAGTYVYAKKESLVFKNEDEMKTYASSHPEEFPELKNTAADAENARIAQEDSILDLSTMDKNREEAQKMPKFDEFEKQKEEEAKAKTAVGPVASRPKVNLMKTDDPTPLGPKKILGEDNPENEGAVNEEAEPSVEETKALADLAALEGVTPEEVKMEKTALAKNIQPSEMTMEEKKTVGEEKAKTPSKTSAQKSVSKKSKAKPAAKKKTVANRPLEKTVKKPSPKRKA